MSHLRHAFYMATITSIITFICVGIALIPPYSWYCATVATIAFLSMFLVQVYSFNICAREYPIPQYRLYIGLSLLIIYYVLGAFTIIPVVVLNSFVGEIISILIYITIIALAGYYTRTPIIEEVIL